MAKRKKKDIVWSQIRAREYLLNLAKNWKTDYEKGVVVSAIEMGIGKLPTRWGGLFPREKLILDIAFRKTQD